MSVTSTTYTAGGNSKLIQISGEIGSVNIISGVDAAITSLGWTAYDTISTTQFSPIVTKVYRVLNNDGITYKYAIIRWDTVKCKYYFTTCESWNTTTHTPLNESWSAGGGFIQGYDTTASYIIVSATARHLMLWSFINGSAGMWQAIVEFERISTEDLASVSTSPVPCWAYTNSIMIGTRYVPNGDTISTTMFAFPRLADGSTGYLAANAMNPVTNKGMMPYNNPAGVTIGADVNLMHLGSYYKNVTYRWDTTGLKVPLSPITVDHATKSMPFGRAFNFGVFRPIGGQGDTVYANVDPTGGWPNSNVSTSTNTECFLLPTNGGYEPYLIQSTAGNLFYSNSSSCLNATAGVISLAGGTSVYAGKTIAIGDNMWFCSSDGIRTVSISSGTGGVSVQRYSYPYGVFDIVFDGQRSIYGSHGNGIIKIDTINYGVTANINTFAPLITNGAGYLGIDNKNVYVSTRARLSPQSLYVLDQATLTMSTSNICTGNASGSACSFTTPIPDYTGNVLVGTTAGGQATSGVSLYNFMFNSNTGGIVGYSTGFNTGGSQYGGQGFHFDYVTNRYFCVQLYGGGNSYGAQEYFYPNLVATGTSFNNSYIGYSTSQSYYHCNLFYNNGSYDYQGDCSVTPFRGMFLVHQKNPGWNSGGSQAAGFAVQFISPFNTGNPVGVCQFNTSSTSNNGLITHPYNAWCSGLWTDGCRLFGSSNASNSQQYIVCITGVYNVTAVSGYPTARLILRG